MTSPLGALGYSRYRHADGEVAKMPILLGALAVAQMLVGLALFGSDSAVSKGVAIGAFASGVLVLGLAAAVSHLAVIRAEMKKANALRMSEMQPDQVAKVMASLNPPWYAKRSN